MILGAALSSGYSPLGKTNIKDTISRQKSNLKSQNYKSKVKDPFIPPSTRVGSTNNRSLKTSPLTRGDTLSNYKQEFV
jgi:hypothetical protein